MFSPDSEQVLVSCAIDPVQATLLGVREALTIDDLPEFARRHGDDILPALVFPWKTIRGEVVEQVRPPAPILNGDGKPSKYLWPAGTKPVINVLRPVVKPKRVLIVEGTKQTHAALRYAPKRWLVVGHRRLLVLDRGWGRQRRPGRTGGRPAGHHHLRRGYRQEPGGLDRRVEAG